MSHQSKLEYLNEIRKRYKNSSKSEKGKILDEFCKICCYNRKYAIQLLQPSETKTKSNLSKRGRKREYDDPIIFKVIHHIWIKTNLPCSKRLKMIIPLWLPFCEQQFSLTDELRTQILKVSASSIDRFFKAYRHRHNQKGFATTKPGSILKKRIAIKTNQWDESRPGFVEADTVAHCGSTTAGQFVYTVNCVDIATSWTEQRAAWGKGEKGVLEAIKSMEKSFPFTVKGFDCDNGSEFLNWHLYRHFANRKRPVQFTRSRPYYKNDNAHIEEKNWTNIRQYLGYYRFEKQVLVGMLNNLYTTEWNLYFNYFIPSFKLIKKERVGSKTVKQYDKPKTPFQRILESADIPESTKEKLNEKFKLLDPFKLQAKMENKIKLITKIANCG